MKKVHLSRIAVALRDDIVDSLGEKIVRKIRAELNIAVKSVRLIKIFTLEGLNDEQVADIMRLGVLHDPVLHTVGTEKIEGMFDWVLEVGFRPGVTDNEGRTARESIAAVLGIESQSFSVFTSKEYVLSGVNEMQVEQIAKDLLANELIEYFQFKSRSDWERDGGFSAKAVNVKNSSVPTVKTIDLTKMNDAALAAFSKENTLALSLAEMQAICVYFSDLQVQTARQKAGFPLQSTDAEIECLAQTWSEHCKHKIFRAEIDYEDSETGQKQVIKSLYKTYIQGSTEAIRQQKGKDDVCLSVFKDNAGVIRFDDEMSVCIKVETHNSPSALDPYGGALTGIVGVNRDPMGTGMGAALLCNTDVFCFASPFYDKSLPPRLLHPRRILEGVREGVEHGGNKSGIPTVNGAIVFDERYLGKPLVFCGTVGLIPALLHGKPGHEKQAQVGDKIIMVGGRIGKDGIHGATFSSEELHDGSPATAVQIGDPITQRKMYDFLLRARDLGLYNAITDNGAGGLSSSVGEMAEMTGGAFLDLSKAPLKYDGLNPWEILISEAQERMTLAVSPEKLTEFLQLAEIMCVEASELGEFTDSGFFHVVFADLPVAYLDMHFLHDGFPDMHLRAVWKAPLCSAESEPMIADHGEFLQLMLGRLNICSKEYIIRQYDHEVKGKSVVKPLVGLQQDGPADAAVFRPRFDSDRGIVLGCGICPKFSDIDTYWMMANCIDEAVRNCVAVGGNPTKMVGVDNFCWCDPIVSEKNPDGEQKLAQLVRANQALAHFCQCYGVACISGKDSMKNDYTGGGRKISIPPTVLFTVLGIVDNIRKSVTSDWKCEGEAIYILGKTARELGGSEAYGQLGCKGGSVPKVDGVAALKRYITYHDAVQKGFLRSGHDLSDGGLAVALAEMALAGRLGGKIDLDYLPVAEQMSDIEKLYSESASRLLVTVAPEHQTEFENLFAGQDFAKIGQTNGSGKLTVCSGQKTILEKSVEELAGAWKKTLNF